MFLFSSLISNLTFRLPKSDFSFTNKIINT
nr:MAG TPA: hypothetical protein [Caudoviricetes sp.]